jgi:uncharacterized protein (DUF2062 family)
MTCRFAATDKLGLFALVSLILHGKKETPARARILQLLALGLRKIWQPTVIAEVIGGILLGPTAFGRIPGFTSTLFPPSSIPILAAVANLGKYPVV